MMKKIGIAACSLGLMLGSGGVASADTGDQIVFSITTKANNCANSIFEAVQTLLFGSSEK